MAVPSNEPEHGVAWWQSAGNRRLWLRPAAISFFLLLPVVYALASGGARFAIASLLLLLLLGLSAIDIKFGLLPDKLVLLFGLSGILVGCCGGLAPLPDAAGGAVLGGAIMLAVRFFSGGGLGGGDVKLSFSLGLWLGIKGIALALWLAFLSGSVVALALLLAGRKKRQDSLPFGPCLALGAMVAFLFGDELWALYERLL